MILLGGPNGYGKTSLLDAVEWCLTGTVFRLKDDYETRNEKKNSKIKKCLIRHNGQNKDVIVEVIGSYQKETISLKRIFNDSDESKAFFSENSQFIINGEIITSNKTIDNILNQPIARDFYERFTCSYEKNIRVYEKSRTDIYEMFSSFFGGTKEIETIINNLDGINKGKKDRKIGIIENLDKKVSLEIKPKFEKSKEKYDETIEKLNLVLKGQDKNELEVIFHNYPSVLYYQGEIEPITIIESSDNYQNKISRLKKQNHQIINIKFLKENYETLNLAKKYKTMIEKKKHYNDFIEQILKPFNTYQKEIISVQDKIFVDVKLEKESFDSMKENLDKFPNATRDGVKLLKAISKKFTDLNSEQLNAFNAIDSLIENYNSLSLQLEGFKTPDEELNALRSLIDHLNGFEIHKEKGNVICPLCGSDERFSKKEHQLAKIATEILGEIDVKRASLQKKFNDSQLKIRNKYQNHLSYLKEKIDAKIDFLNILIKNYETTSQFRDSCKKFMLEWEKVNLQQLEQVKEELEKEMEEELVHLTIETNIIEKLSNENGELQGIYDINKQPLHKLVFQEQELTTKINSLSQFINLYNNKREETPIVVKIGEIQMDHLVTKHSILNNIIDRLEKDQSIKNVEKELDIIKKIYEEDKLAFEIKVKELDKLKDISKELKLVRNQWDREIVEEIKVPLQKIYRRINRHTNVQNIDLLIDGKTNTMASLVANINNEDVSATNILSAGQLSVMALAIFLTVSMGQKLNQFKCYFLDDPIQTMDDLNILSFIDLLRTELSADNNKTRFIDQLFFTTCDENLERLMIHKMKSFGINYTHVHFTGYGEYETLS